MAALEVVDLPVAVRNRLAAQTPSAIDTKGESHHRYHNVEELDFHWLVGVLEGEGSFITNREARNSYPVIKVEMCDQEVIERAAFLLEARVWIEGPRAQGWRPTYVARIARQRAAEWMRQLRPSMGIRRTAAIDAALSTYQPIRLIAPPLVCVVEGCERPHRPRGLC